MGIEEQEEERQVLDSIFPDEITDVSKTSYRVKIALEVKPEPGDEEDAEPPAISLTISYPDAYPDVAPYLDLSSQPNAPKHPLLDVFEDRAGLLKSLETPIEENMGMAMIFTLVTTLKESAEQLIAERQGAIQAQKDQESARAEEEENRKFYGTVVTKERFVEWRERFCEEIAEKDRLDKEEREAEDKKKRGGKVEEKKVTGRQLWERGLVGKGDEEEESADDDIDAMERLKVAA